MNHESLINKGVTKECAAYCMRGIVQLLDGNISKFEEYSQKALEINQRLEAEANWTNCLFKKGNKKIKARLNMLTNEIRDMDGNILRAGISK